jgi:4-hydroxy-tetrahydrodipicolinate synthase
MLEREVRYRTIEVAVEEAGGKVPVLAGTGDVNTQAVIENNRKAAELGAYATLLIPPFYFGQSQQSMIDFYREVADEGSLPVVIYNFPQISKIYMEPASVKILSKEKNIIGIKDSSGNFINFQTVLTCQSDNFIVYQGVGAISCAGLMMKAGGFISPVANIDPDIEVEMYRAVLNGKLDLAVELQHKVQKLIGLWRGYNGPAPSVIKALLKIMGVCDTFPCKPNPVIRGEELESLRKKYEELGL